MKYNYKFIKVSPKFEYQRVLCYRNKDVHKTNYGKQVKIMHHNTNSLNDVVKSRLVVRLVNVVSHKDWPQIFPKLSCGRN